MDMSNLIKIKSNSVGRVVLYIPEFNFKRTFEKKGTVKSVPFDVLSQAIYDEGIERLFKYGILSIEDKDMRVQLGLEEGDAPEEVLILDDNQKRRLLTLAPLHDLKETCSKLVPQQILELVYFAIENEIGNFDKASFLKEVTNIDIMKAIELNRAAKEEE